MLASTSITRREIQIARILRPLGQAPMTGARAECAGQLLHVHWTTVYRLRRRFLRDPVTTKPGAQRERPPQGAASPARRGRGGGCRGA